MKLVQKNFRNSQATVLVMLSGGLDSVAMLYKMLTETHQNEILHVHHIALESWESDYKSDGELTAAHKTMGYFKDYRFEHSHSWINYFYPVFDQTQYYHTAGCLAACLPKVHSVAIGRTKSDLFNFTRYDPKQEVIQDHEELFYLTAKSFCTFKSKKINSKLIFPVQNYTKTELYNCLPTELKETFWSCRRPSNWDTICGKCSKCKEIQKIKEKNKWD